MTHSRQLAKERRHGHLRRPVRASRDQHCLCAAREQDPRAGSEGGQRHLLRPGAGAGPARRAGRPDRAHPRALHARAVPPAPRRRRAAVRQQRPLPAELAREPRPDAADAARAGLPALRPDHLVHADGPRSVEPAHRQDAGALRAALRDQVRGQAAPARGALAGPGAAGHRGHVAGAAQHVAHARAARRGHQRLSRLPGPVGGGGGRRGEAHPAARPARVRRPHRRAGPRAAQPLLHHRAQVLPCPRHRGGGPRGGLAARALDPVRGRARHRGGAPLVLDLRDGLPGGPEPARQSRSRAARQRHGAHPRRVARAAAGDPERPGAGLHRPARGAAQGRAGSSPDHRHDPARLRAAHHRDGRRQRLLDAAAQLRVLQHGALVLRHVPAPAPPQAPLRGRRLRHPRGASPEAHPGQQPGEDRAAQGLRRR